MESKRSLEMIELFKNFDWDNSGKLDFEEMKHLFEENDMPIDEDSLRNIFKVIHKASMKNENMDKKFIH